MILINKGTNNLVIFTLKEKTTRPNPKYLFEFSNSQTNESITCIAADTSDYPERYNSFEIVEITSPSPLLAQVELTPSGFWEYKVYAQDSATNLQPANADELVETGLAYVVGTAETTYTYNDQPTNAFIYNG
ncbi:MAG: hypothetical protein F9K23_07150 [Bacteroidetes bacterium]|nr:MAG: hypothetical protein F9K23_07150 [Bacteroidota bacterium]